jgi:hypothetical protein
MSFLKENDIALASASKTIKAPSYKGDTMSFEKELFNQIKAAIPTMNVRRFSKYCGKSDGYYGSITAQALPISTNALLHLAEMLTQVQSHTPSKALDRALVMITETVAHRMQHIDTHSWAVRQMIIKAVARAQASNVGDDLAPLPILLG